MLSDQLGIMLSGSDQSLLIFGFTAKACDENISGSYSSKQQYLTSDGVNNKCKTYMVHQLDQRHFALPFHIIRSTPHSFQNNSAIVELQVIKRQGLCCQFLKDSPSCSPLFWHFRPKNWVGRKLQEAVGSQVTPLANILVLN